MFHMKYLFYFILLHLINSAPQINLYYTDRVSESESDADNLQHDCLRVAHPDTKQNSEHDGGLRPRALTSYCMSESPSNFTIQKNDLFPKFTFAELSKRNITSQQLYIWSAPIDIIERYQFYLDQLSTSFHDLSMTTEVFYNCTWPRFGPMCQYQLEYDNSRYSSLYDIVGSFYETYKYQPTNLTCYTHLQCYRGPSPSCLDWTEICDGVVDCLDGGLDEEDCWQLEIYECNKNEFRCGNGRCIPKLFYADKEHDSYDYIDGSDNMNLKEIVQHLCAYIGRSFRFEDVSCPRNGLTSSCVIERQHLLVQAMFSTKDESIRDECWSAFKCIMHIYKVNDPTCLDVCSRFECITIIRRTCPDTMFIPNVPVLFSHIYLAYQKNASEIFESGGLQYLYICYNNSYYDNYFPTGSQILINNVMCYHRKNTPSFQKPTNPSKQPSMFDIHEDLWRYSQVFNYTTTFCNRSDMYQCANSSKCISIYRRNNKVNDCPQGDDENPAEILNSSVVDPLSSLNNYKDRYNQRIFRYMRMNISFQTICNGYTELIPIIINGQNETDETECEQWECNNIYTRCNERWNCLSGEDELNCDLSPKLRCSSTDHICVSPNSTQLMCLSIEKANDGNVDCLGGTDEPALCRQSYELECPDRFHCKGTAVPRCINAEQLCEGNNDCEYGDDESFCEDNSPREDVTDFCYSKNFPDKLTDVEQSLCKSLKSRNTNRFIFFSLVEPKNFYGIRKKNIENKAFLRSSIIEMPRQYQPRCHRGLDLRVWLNATNYLPSCLCPPNFYGDTCQYQNQRVILGIKFGPLSDSWRTFFAIVISLIDDSDQRIIHSYEQLTYLSIRDCRKEYNFYLLYSTRPKNQTKHYSIHVDIYEKVSLTYRGSLLFPIHFSFLPVHHLVLIINIPQSNDNNKKCSNARKCVHGKCMKYSNNQNVDYCQCSPGWTGRYCTIKHDCSCSSDSLCIGVSADNRSICVCRSNKFGPRCLMNTVCQINDTSTCTNKGQCVAPDEYIGYKQTFTCICPKGFTGPQCELVENKLILFLEKDIPFSQSIFIHFIRVMYEDFPVRATTFATISVNQDSLTIYWSQKFHIAFMEVPINNYYLIVVQKNPFEQSSIINETIKPSDRCPHIREIFNETILQWHPLRQIKYYHLVCQNYSLNLSCFYDNVNLCLCYDYEEKRLANCFEFHHNMTMDCGGSNGCEHGGQCFLDDPNCPKRSVCLCQACFFGGLCQFRTSGFDLSLDGILGYHIQPHTSITHQSVNVKISVALTIIFLVVGLINGLLSMITFKSKIIQEVGCGLYLFGSSITTLLTTIIFGLKFWILMVSQMGIISNEFFLSFQCYSIDFILRICLNMDQWLNACVAIDRAYATIKGASFSKKKSKQIAKLVIIIILIVNIGTSIHDPIYRKVIEEENDGGNEKRTWCIVNYSPSLQVYNSAVYIFHFFGPFIINLVSSIILIIKKTLQQSKVHTRKTFKVLLQEQLREHKHLLIAPMLLIILAVPRLIISFVSKCMKSANDSWIFLIGYFISFIPPMLTFVIFVLPSTFYKNEFHKIVTRYKVTIQRRFHFIS